MFYLLSLLLERICIIKEVFTDKSLVEKDEIVANALPNVLNKYRDLYRNVYGKDSPLIEEGMR
jgi:hypothetical protein